MKKHTILFILAIAAILQTVSGNTAKKKSIPGHPSKISYRTLAWKVPDGEP